MNVINAVIGGVILLFFILALAQPFSILSDVHQDILTNNNTVKTGTNTSGIIEDVGVSFFGGDISNAFFLAIGFAFFIGFMIWLGRGASDPRDDFIQQGGF